MVLRGDWATACSIYVPNFVLMSIFGRFSSPGIDVSRDPSLLSAGSWNMPGANQTNLTFRLILGAKRGKSRQGLSLYEATSLHGKARGSPEDSCIPVLVRGVNGLV